MKNSNSTTDKGITMEQATREEIQNQLDCMKNERSTLNMEIGMLEDQATTDWLESMRTGIYVFSKNHRYSVK